MKMMQSIDDYYDDEIDFAVVVVAVAVLIVVEFVDCIQDELDMI